MWRNNLENKIKNRAKQIKKEKGNKFNLSCLFLLLKNGKKIEENIEKVVPFLKV